MAIKEDILQEIITSSKPKRGAKKELLLTHKKEILELRKRGLSIAKIVEYLKKAYKIKTTTEYLKKIIPEVSVSKEEYLLRQMKGMTNDQIVKAILELGSDRALEIAEKLRS
jgi:hypothetical protein